MHKELTRYLDTHNLMLQMFKQDTMSLDTPLARQALFERLASDLSPENLHCDGECSRSQVRARLAYYNKVWAQLEQLHGRKVSEAEVWEWDR